MLFESICAEARKLREGALTDLPAAATHRQWATKKRAQWRDMLGIDDAHLACDLDPHITQRCGGERFTVESLHFQAIPGHRIACNLWLPKSDIPLESRPCVIYLCGHSPTGKWWYQPHGRWFAEQGDVCLMLDAIQIGENRGVHHGTFLKGWWHWISQGYVPGAAEVQIARRALDYLATRPEADATRCGVTGISGGATMSLFAGAADERFAAVVPHCIAGTVHQTIEDRTLDTHCDCAMWVNRLQWEVHDVAALIAPRPLLMSFSAFDALCRPQPIRDMVARLRPLWSTLGASDKIDLSEDDIPHAYSPKITRRILGWFDRHLKGGSGEIAEKDNIAFTGPWTEDRTQRLPEAKLAAFTANDPPLFARMEDVDRRFIRLPGPLAPASDIQAWQAEQSRRLAALRQITFRNLGSAKLIEQRPLGVISQTGVRCQTISFQTSDGLKLDASIGTLGPTHVIAPCPPDAHRMRTLVGAPESVGSSGMVYVRGTGNTSLGEGLHWFARRAYPAVGYSLPERQTVDLIHGVRLLRRLDGVQRVALYGKGDAAAMCIYAALLGEVDELILEAPATTHWDGGPEFPGILRVGDLPDNLALWCPRPITFVGAMPPAFEIVRQVYALCGATRALRTITHLSQWQSQGE